MTMGKYCLTQIEVFYSTEIKGIEFEFIEHACNDFNDPPLTSEAYSSAIAQLNSGKVILVSEKLCLDGDSFGIYF